LSALLRLALGAALLLLDLLGFARLLQLLALASRASTAWNTRSAPSGFSPARALLRSKASARIPSALTTIQDSSSSQWSRTSALGALSRGSSHITRPRMPGTTSESWILVTSSPVLCTVQLDSLTSSTLAVMPKYDMPGSPVSIQPDLLSRCSVQA
jgi:hypothetical protein